MLETFKLLRRKLLTRFEMRPIHNVIRLLKKHDFLLMNRVLEVFGYTGAYHTLDYIKYVKHLEIWELSADCEVELKKNLPEAEVKITDSYAEIKKTTSVYDTIIIDNHQGIFGGDKCEHFEIIDDCFKKLAPKSVIITNVLQDILISKYEVSKETQQQHIEKRKVFYNHPTGTAISLSDMEVAYRKLAAKNGFNLKHIFFVKRNYLVTYMALCLERV